MTFLSLFPFAMRQKKMRINCINPFERENKLEIQTTSVV